MHRLFILLSLLLLSCGLYAQHITLSGTVADESILSLPGVSVSVKGTTIGTITGGDGGDKVSTPVWWDKK